MKKVLGLIGLLALMVSGTAFAQDNQSHDVQVTIPSYLQIRMVDGSGNRVSGALSPVVFDFAGNPTLFSTGAPLGQTNAAANNWADVEVTSNGGPWKVNVGLSSSPSFDWSKVAVDNGAGLTFPLTQTTPVVTGVQTTGWQSLGFGPDDFSVTFDGTEAATTTATGHQVTVTYTISANP